MRILVTGRRGQLARCLAARWAGAADRELLFACRPAVDFEDPATIVDAVKAARPDVIVSAAAYTAVDQAEDEPERADRINAQAPAVLAASAAEIGARLIHISTDYVFDGRAAAPYPETAPTNPLGVYGRTKLAGERAVLESGAEALIVRTAWVYSPFGKNFVSTMLTLAAQRDELRVVADQVGNPTSAFDIVDGLQALLGRWAEALAGGDRIFHLAGSGAASWADVAEEIMKVSAQRGGPAASVARIASSDWPTRALRPPNSRLDCALMEARCSYRAAAWQDSLVPVVAALLEAER